MSEDDEYSPYQQGLIAYRLNLLRDMERDYQTLDLLYNSINQLDVKYKNGEITILEHTDRLLKLSQQITTIHDRIRRRLFL